MAARSITLPLTSCASEAKQLLEQRGELKALMARIRTPPPSNPLIAPSQLVRERKFRTGLAVQVCKGDLTLETVDVIVNAANGHLMHGGGVAGAIARKGGAVVNKASRDWVGKYGEVPTGDVAATAAGSLPCKVVVHAVGPVWGGNPSDRDEELKSAVMNSLRLADLLGARSISIPAISSGIFGFPKPRCARIMFDAVTSFFSTAPASLALVRLCNFDRETVDIFTSEFDARFSEEGEDAAPSTPPLNVEDKDEL